MSAEKCTKTLVILLVLLVVGLSAVHAQEGNPIVPAGARLRAIRRLMLEAEAMPPCSKRRRTVLAHAASLYVYGLMLTER